MQRFLSLLNDYCPGSGLPRRGGRGTPRTGDDGVLGVAIVLVGSVALADHGVERIAEHAAWASIQAADVLEVARFSQVAFDKPHVAPGVQSLPDGDGLGREAAVSMLPHQTNAPSWDSE